MVVSTGGLWRGGSFRRSTRFWLCGPWRHCQGARELTKKPVREAGMHLHSISDLALKLDNLTFCLLRLSGLAVNFSFERVTRDHQRFPKLQ
jgi:hypothetical protein